MSRRFVSAALLVCASAGVVAQQTPAAQSPQVFRTDVALTRIELSVLDKKTRAPITGLTAKDFEVKVNGRAQPIRSLAEVSIPGAGAVPAPGLVEASRDVATNALTSPRLFVVIMNDAVGGLDPYYRKTGQAIAHRIVDALGPQDLAAVVFVRDNSSAQDFVQDRVLLRRAVDEYRPQSIDPRLARSMATMVLLRSLQFLRPMSTYRRAVVFISPAKQGGEEVATDDLKLFSMSQELGQELDLADASVGGLAQVPVYAFSAEGLPAPTTRDIARSATTPLLQWFDRHTDTLRTIADLSGGRATVATNAPAEGVPAMFNELASYYALAYEPTHPADARVRRLDVRVPGRDVLVVSSREVRSASPATHAAAGRGGGVATGLRTALESPLPLGGLPLRLAATPLALSGAREQAVVMTLGLPPTEAAARFGVRVLVTDGEGRRQVLDTARTVDLPKASDGEGSEVLLRVSLRPGRYNIRVAAERGGDLVAGTVQATVDVPDFGRQRLALSGVAIGRGDGRRIAGRQEIDGLLPFAPTAVRTFDVDDRVGALLRVHQASKPSAVTVTTAVTDALGAVVVTASTAIAPAAFANGVAEHRYELPLRGLTAGPYLLRFTATTGTTTAQREVRFFVR